MDSSIITELLRALLETEHGHRGVLSSLAPGFAEVGGEGERRVSAMGAMAWCGRVAFERVRGRTVASSCWGRYPLKFMLPSKVAGAEADAVWVYVLTYGGGVLSGDGVAYQLDVRPSCTAAITTQASTKVYRSRERREAVQCVEARVAAGALLVIVPDPIVCFASALYKQRQTFYIAPGSSLLLVDWLTCGRRERGEVWAFEKYESHIHVFVGTEPLLLDSVVLSESNGLSISEKMNEMSCLAMVLVYGPRLVEVEERIQARVRENARVWANSRRSRASPGRADDAKAEERRRRRLFASSSILELLGEEEKASAAEGGGGGGSRGGIIVRIAGDQTEDVHDFLRECLAPLEKQLGASPYASSTSTSSSS